MSPLNSQQQFFSTAASCFFVLIVCAIVSPSKSANVSFVPQPISIKTSDLPAPFATSSASKGARVIPIPDDPSLYVPAGFTVKSYMIGLNAPRYMIYTPSDDILVSETRNDRISCLLNNDHDGYPDERITFADSSNGLRSPFGMLFLNGYFYVGNRDAVRRYPWSSGSRNISGTGEVIMTYGDNGHTTRTIVVSPSGDRIRVSIGSASNVDVEALPRASVQEANLDGSDQKTFAHGLRNVVGLAYHPVTNDLYASCQERDELGDDLVPDFFTRIQQDEYYGWPFAYMTPNLIDPRRRLSNGSSERPDLVSMTKTPDILFQAHSSVLDMRFYTGKQFPSRYHNGAFATFRGSWNRNNGTGYKVIFIPFDSTTNRPMGYYEDFVFGFLTNPAGPDTFGRPVGLLVLKDGSIIFSEDGNNRLYQVQYQQNSSDTTSAGAITSSSTGPISTSTKSTGTCIIPAVTLVVSCLLCFFSLSII